MHASIPPLVDKELHYMITFMEHSPTQSSCKWVSNKWEVRILEICRQVAGSKAVCSALSPSYLPYKICQTDT